MLWLIVLFFSRNIGLYWRERLPSLLPVLVPWREVARPTQQALGEETHHSGGERTFKLLKTHRQCCTLKDLKAVFQFGRGGFFILLHIPQSNFMRNQAAKICPLRGAAVSSTFAILSQYWLIAQREESLNTGGDSWCLWCKRFFLTRSLHRSVPRNEKLRQNFKENHLDTSYCSSSLECHGFCQA